MAFAMAAPVLAVSLQQAGYRTGAIGAFAMISFLLVGLLIPVVPRLLARWGVVRVYRGGAAFQLAAALGYALGDGLALWSVCSVLSGIGAAALWNATEALLAREAPPDQRGRVMGLYQTGARRGAGARALRARPVRLVGATGALGRRRAGRRLLRDRVLGPRARQRGAAAALAGRGPGMRSSACLSWRPWPLPAVCSKPA
jgi:MFS family permease